MLIVNSKNKRSSSWKQATAPLGRPGARANNSPLQESAASIRSYLSTQSVMSEAQNSSLAFNQNEKTSLHALTKSDFNSKLFGYERSVKAAFDAIEPTLKQISSLQGGNEYESSIRQLIKEQLGFEVPSTLLDDSWVQKIDMRRLYAWCLFETYKHYCNTFLTEFPYCGNDKDFQSFMQECGFHAFDISPCADGRLAHVISYVLRLPYRSVRRKSYAGAMFDVEDSLDKWVETEMIRFREGKSNINGLATRYLKAVVYHFSSRDPHHEGCAAHGSNDELAAKSGLERLTAFKQAVENTYCCGASVETLLIGLDTDTDAIRVHVPGDKGDIRLDKFISAHEIYDSTRTMSATTARKWVQDYVADTSQAMHDGMVNLLTYLLINNISQIDYVKTYHSGNYEDIGHAERFIGAGIGFEEVQLRNLTYFAYLNTVEEAVKDLDVGIKIFSNLNISRGLPVPIIVRYDYHGNVPGARERAVEHCQRVTDALGGRYQDLESQGLLHILMATKDVNNNSPIEILGTSISAQATQEAH